MSLVTKGDIKSLLQSEESTNDVLIETLIAQVEERIKYQYLNGTDFDAASDYDEITEYLDGDGSDTILVGCVPLRSITSIYINTDEPRIYTGADDLLDSSSYVFYENEGKIRLLSNVFTVGYKTVAIKYKAGWKTSNAPERLKTAIKFLVLADLLEMVGNLNVFTEATDTFFYKPAKLRKTAEDYLADLKVYR